MAEPRPINETRRNVKRSEVVAHRIAQAIANDGLGLGDRLPPENAMLDQYGVSRASLREALRMLEVQGLLSLRPGPGGGPIVGVVDAENLARTASLFFQSARMTYRELFQTQGQLEPLCGELAAAHPDRAAVKEAFTPFLSSDHTVEGVEYFHVTHDFHERVYRFTDNRMLVLLTSAISYLVRSHVMASMDPVHRRATLHEEHTAIAHAIIAGEVEATRNLMSAHYLGQIDYYYDRWPDKFDQVVEWRLLGS